MDPTTPFSRRIFLQQGVTLASLVSTIPWFLQHSALGMLSADSRVSSQAGVPEDRILVVVQLSGGNDGLNTVIPYGSDDYYRARTQLGIAAPGKENGALELDRTIGIGLHPNLNGFKDLYDDGRLAVVQGTGYPNPNRSHFASMDIWHTANRSGRGDGWIGRYVDCTCKGSPAADAEVAIGRSAPLAMIGTFAKPVAFEDARLFQWMGKDLPPHSMAAPYDQMNRAGALDGVEPGSQAAFLMRTALDAQLSSDRIRAAIARTPLVPYPGTRLATQMRSIGAMIRDGLKTRVYYASQTGYDTHSNQAGSHGNLMRELSEAVSAFQADLKAQGNDTRVVTMVFSEFGRRVRQNASGGTDHGTAAPMFVVGSPIKGGLHGAHPSMTDLDNGDLKFTTDFRSVYATILDKWMGAPSNAILGGSYPNLKFIRG
ncbi:MAG: DUF1501 domain-containing protein [Phycisphaerales bacterium]|nr:DUF1501 domain-containing protein [Phycisphaerales bacterium]